MGEDLLLTLRTDSRIDTLEPSGLNASNGLIDSVTAHDQEVVWGHRQTNLVGGVDADSLDRVSRTRWPPAHHRSVGREQDRLGAVLHRPSPSSKSRAYLSDRHAETNAERVINGGRLSVVQPDRCDGPSPLDLSFGRLELEVPLRQERTNSLALDRSLSAIRREVGQKPREGGMFACAYKLDRREQRNLLSGRLPHVAAIGQQFLAQARPRAL
jgi:hypothetical protein